MKLETFKLIMKFNLISSRVYFLLEMQENNLNHNEAWLIEDIKNHIYQLNAERKSIYKQITNK